MITGRVPPALVVLGSFTAYALAFLALYPTMGGAVAISVVIPIIAAGWLMGMRAGFLYGLLSIPLNTLLLYLAVQSVTGWGDPAMGIGSSAVVLIGGVVGRIRDLSVRVTEQARHLERERKTLHESEEKYRVLVENSPNMVGILQDGVLKYINPAMCERLGWTYEQMTSPSFNLVEKLVPQRLQPLVKENMAKRLRGEHVPPYEFPVKTRDGLEIPVIDSGQRILHKGKPAIEFIYTDITERKKAENALRESEERFRKIFEEGPIGMALTDQDFKFVKANDAFCKMLGFGEQELTRLTFLDITHVEDIDTSVQHARKIFSGKQAGFQIEKRYVTKNKEIVWANVTASRFLDREGKLQYVLSTAENITERKQMAEEKIRAEAKAVTAEERLRLQEARSRFVSAAAHELKTPLVSIKGYTDLILSGALGESPQPLKDSLKVILRNTDRMLQLISELLDIQRLDSGILSPKMEAGDLAEVVEQSTQNMMPVINNKKLQLELMLPNSVLKVFGDKLRLHQVMDNLLSNAIKYTPENGKIRITVTEEANQFRVSVSDTGIGISPEYLSHIFDPFSKIPKASHAGGYGVFGVYETGLGLSVTKRLVEMHGGKIWAESEGEGKGTTVTFIIPRGGKFDQNFGS